MTFFTKQLSSYQSSFKGDFWVSFLFEQSWRNRVKNLRNLGPKIVRLYRLSWQFLTLGFGGKSAFQYSLCRAALLAVSLTKHRAHHRKECSGRPGRYSYRPGSWSRYSFSCRKWLQSKCSKSGKESHCMSQRAWPIALINYRSCRCSCMMPGKSFLKI